VHEALAGWGLRRVDIHSPTSTSEETLSNRQQPYRCTKARPHKLIVLYIDTTKQILFNMTDTTGMIKKTRKMESRWQWVMTKAKSIVQCTWCMPSIIYRYRRDMSKQQKSPPQHMTEWTQVTSRLTENMTNVQSHMTNWTILTNKDVKNYILRLQILILIMWAHKKKKAISRCKIANSKNTSFTLPPSVIAPFLSRTQ
jgi:hypothetical protein